MSEYVEFAINTGDEPTLIYESQRGTAIASAVWNIATFGTYSALTSEIVSIAIEGIKEDIETYKKANETSWELIDTIKEFKDNIDDKIEAVMEELSTIEEREKLIEEENEALGWYNSLNKIIEERNEYGSVDAGEKFFLFGVDV